MYWWVSCEWELKQQVTAFRCVDTQQVTQLRKHEAAAVLVAACVKVYQLCSVMCVSGQTAYPSWTVFHMFFNLSNDLFFIFWSFDRTRIGFFFLWGIIWNWFQWLQIYPYSIQCPKPSSSLLCLKSPKVMKKFSSFNMFQQTMIS